MSESVTLEYIGHSCFLITAPDGTRIVSDPYGWSHPKGLSAFPDDIHADVVTISHTYHTDHSNAAAIGGTPRVLTKPGSHQVGIVSITGSKSDHGLVNGVSRGDNTVFVFEIGEIKIAHLGAAGVVTQADVLAAINNADVITIDLHGDAAHPLGEQVTQTQRVNARTMIPIHYSLDKHSRYGDALTLDEFLQALPQEAVVVRNVSSIQVTSDMPERVAILTPLALVSE
jgi:L-ascorbate metabolism protein UlaG (beta-lactamase superfamily)